MYFFIVIVAMWLLETAPVAITAILPFTMVPLLSIQRSGKFFFISNKLMSWSEEIKGKTAGYLVKIYRKCFVSDVITTQFFNDTAAKDNADALDRIKAMGKVQVHVLTPQEKQAWIKALMPVHKEMESRLQSATGKAADSNYLRAEARDHTRAIRRARALENQVTDPGLKDYIASLIPVLQKHQRQAHSLWASLGGRPAATPAAPQQQPPAQQNPPRR